MLIERVKKTIEEQHLIEKNQHIVLGLSGGPDSVCLFHVLTMLKKQMKLNIYPVHLNHKFRPVEAERDQAYAENLCRKLGSECRTFVVDCNKLAEELSLTSEEAGRKARYDAFYQTAEEVAAKLTEDGMSDEEAKACVKIAVAHNANDQAETILFRLLRGTGTDGLAGIAYKRQERGFEVIRPILDIYRNEIEEYCSINDLQPVIDHTNNEMLYARNKIRLELIPFIENGYNENIKESFVRLGRIAAEDKEYIWHQVEKEYERLVLLDDAGKESNDEVVMDRIKLNDLHAAVRHRLIMKAFARIGLEKDISEERIKSADSIIEKKQGPKTVQFPHGYRLKVAKGKVIFFKS